LNSLIDYFEWSNIAVPGQRAEAVKMEKTPEVWAHRPLAKTTLDFSVQSICTLHATYPLLSSRLCACYGPSAIEMLANHSHQVVTVHATGGWSCRNAGLWIGEQSGGEVRDDPGLDDWLSRRFGKGPSAAARRQSPETAIRAQKAELPVTAVRPDDSPRTASWRAAVAELALPPAGGGGAARQRSSSPTLESWIARRNQAKTGVPEQKSKRSSSVPAPRTAAQEEKEANEPKKAQRWEGPFSFGSESFGLRPQSDRKAWAEIRDDDGDKEEEEDIFEQLQQQERLRLAQAESA